MAVPVALESLLGIVAPLEEHEGHEDLASTRRKKRRASSHEASACRVGIGGGSHDS
jgi:hypothetical protein